MPLPDISNNVGPVKSPRRRQLDAGSDALSIWSVRAEFQAGMLSASRTQFRPDSLAR